MCVNNLLHTSHAINFLLYVFSAPSFRVEITQIARDLFGLDSSDTANTQATRPVIQINAKASELSSGGKQITTSSSKTAARTRGEASSRLSSALATIVDVVTGKKKRNSKAQTTADAKKKSLRSAQRRNFATIFREEESSLKEEEDELVPVANGHATKAGIMETTLFK